jgi:hypothetical protein
VVGNEEVKKKKKKHQTASVTSSSSSTGESPGSIQEPEHPSSNSKVATLLAVRRGAGPGNKNIKAKEERAPGEQMKAMKSSTDDEEEEGGGRSKEKHEPEHRKRKRMRQKGPAQ